jgi:hypothetical protein
VIEFPFTQVVLEVAALITQRIPVVGQLAVHLYM